MNKYLLALLVVINVIGIIIGTSTYYYSLQKVNPLLWVFLMDCPFAAVFFVLSLFKKEFRSFAFVYIMKYSFWTFLTYGVYWDNLMAFATLFDTFLLLAGHVGMVIQALLFGFQKIGRKYFLAMVCFFLANDLIDYFYTMDFVLPNNKYFGLLLIYNILATIGFSLLVNKKSFAFIKQKN